MVLPWHNPVILAEQAATLDLLSGGRLDFGVGKGYRYNEFTGFAIPLEEADARFEEALAVITKAWTSEQRFSHHGPFWTFNDILVEPPTNQKPHPPFWMGAGSPSSIRRVAVRGYNLLLDQFAAFDVVGERVALFKAERAARGLAHDPMGIALRATCMSLTTKRIRTPPSNAIASPMNEFCPWRAGRTVPADRISWPMVMRPRKRRRTA